jgi:signal peptidase I
MNDKHETTEFSLDDILEQYSSDKPKSYEPEYEEPEEYAPPAKPVQKPAQSKQEETKAVTRKEVCDWVESLIASMTAVVIIMLFFARMNQVYGISMQPTLNEGDRLIVSPIYTELRHGDIIVLRAENLLNTQTGRMGEPIVKRVIGLPGDEININRNGDVFRNGELLDEPYIAEKIAYGKTGNQRYPLMIAEGYVFVMGDNRNHSTDSRDTFGSGALYYVGCVEMGNIIGKAVFRVYPFDTFGGLS